MSSDLKWASYVYSIVQKASVASYHIMKNFHSKNIWILLQLFKTYVRPKLEYATTVWSPYLKKDIELVERVQRRFTKFAFFKCQIPFTSYADRLTKVNMKSLKDRRLFFDLVLIFRIVRGLSDLKFEDYYYFKPRRYALRGNPNRICSKFDFTSKQMQNCFFFRAVKLWNSLPCDLATAPSLQLFKIKLRQTNLDSFSH